jgi:hypothetical protein
MVALRVCFLHLSIPGFTSLSLRVITKGQAQPIVDRIADQLVGWKAELMTRAGRRVQVQYVLTGALVYLAMAIDVPQSALMTIDKIRRGLLCRGRKDAKEGHCLVAWGRVCRPLHFGGLGISNLKELCWALRMRCLWLQKTDPDLPWSLFPIQVPSKFQDFFSTVLISEVGNGASTLFWTDKWLHGHRLGDTVPRLFAAIPNRIVKTRTIQEVLQNRKWIGDIKGALTIGVLVDYLQLWEMLEGFQLQPDTQDRHIFTLSASLIYSIKAAYEGLFIRSVSFPHHDRVWKTWAPQNVVFSFG